jgi:hypothetical protein
MLYAAIFLFTRLKSFSISQTNKRYFYSSTVSVKTASQSQSPLTKCPAGIQRVLKYCVRKRLILQLSWVLYVYIIYKQKYKQQNYYLFFIFSGSTAQRGLWPPRPQGFLITHNYAPQLVELLWMSEQLVSKTSTWQHTTDATVKHPCLRWDSNPRSQ